MCALEGMSRRISFRTITNYSLFQARRSKRTTLISFAKKDASPAKHPCNTRKHMLSEVGQVSWGRFFYLQQSNSWHLHIGSGWTTSRRTQGYQGTCDYNCVSFFYTIRHKSKTLFLRDAALRVSSNASWPLAFTWICSLGRRWIT